MKKDDGRERLKGSILFNDFIAFVCQWLRQIFISCEGGFIKELCGVTGTGFGLSGTVTGGLIIGVMLHYVGNDFLYFASLG